MMKKKLMRIRPFNMANFSGSGGYIPVYAMLGVAASFPAMLLLWTGLAVSSKIEDGEINLKALKRKILLIMLPVGILTLIGSVSMVIGQTSFYGGSVVFYMLAVTMLLCIGFAGAYMSIYYSAKRFSESSRLTKVKWFLMALIFFVLTLSVEIAVFIGIMTIAPLFS